MTYSQGAFARLVSGLAMLLGMLGTHVYAEPPPAQLRFVSGTKPVPLVELYTSEGCSSCPPADRWLSSLQGDAGLWTEFVPLAFHVDYWDAIGWPDRFANERSGERQYRYRREGVVRGVYTPGVIAGGQEWHGWRRGGAIPTAKTGAAGGELTAVVTGAQLQISYAAPPAAQASSYHVHAAWLAMDQISAVRAGENRGKRLVNDFVVVDAAERSLSAADGLATARFQAQPKVLEQAEALAVWVSAEGQQAPLQATGGWLR